MADDRSSDEIVLEGLRAMPETDLHKLVVEPILKKMASHVLYTHGSYEKGKDFIFVIPDPLGGHVLHVCQVKNQPFSGRADSEQNTITLLRQLLQCSTVEVLNPATQSKELPQQISLWTTYPLPDKDTAGCGPFLAELKQHRCKIISPEDLLALIRQHLPQLFTSLAFPGQELVGAMKQYLAIHHEANALKLGTQMYLPDFYVSLGLSCGATPYELPPTLRSSFNTTGLRVPSSLLKSIEDYSN